MLKTRDYEKYDYIEIIVKKENVDEVVSSYGKFLWKEISRKEDRRYSDVLHVSFYRAHNIENKDRLQLLQVYYEFALNERAELNEKKHHKSRAGICNLIFFATCILAGLWRLIFYFKNPIIFGCGIFLTLGVLFFAVFFGKKLKKLHKLENEKFQIFEKGHRAKINEILDEVNLLTKADNRGEL